MIPWEQACADLGARDPVLTALIPRFAGERLRGTGEPFRVLANALVGQQISVKAADSIFRRLTEALGGAWTPEAVGRLDDATLRSLGLSARKVLYLRGLAEAFGPGGLGTLDWAGESDEAVIARLSALHGIGRWTAEMFLIFCLERPDVLPLDDLGFLKAVRLAYGGEGPGEPRPPPALGPAPPLGPAPGVSAAEANRRFRAWVTERAELWRPWRTVGVWYLWRSLDPHPVAY